MSLLLKNPNCCPTSTFSSNRQQQINISEKKKNFFLAAHKHSSAILSQTYKLNEQYGWNSLTQNPLYSMLLSF